MSSLTRRRFFLGAALTAAQATRVMGANDRIRVGIAGLGRRGGIHLTTFLALSGECEVAALCDVNQAALDKAEARVRQANQPRPKRAVDMREMFADRGVDAVSLPLPNHWHALAAIWACQAGKDVYVEKPACHNIFEGTKLIKAVRKYKRIVQVGSQGRSSPNRRKAMQLLHEGVIGRLYMAKGLCFNRRKSIGRVADSPVPAGLDWDRFLGPAPLRPFNQLRYDYNWHWFWDTGNGDIGNQGVHQLDIAHWGLGRKGLPRSVFSSGGKYIYDDDQETPNTQLAIFDYGDAQIVFEVRGLLTGTEGGMANPGANSVGDLFYGSDGWMTLGPSSFQVYKGEKSEKIIDERAADSQEAANTGPHVQNFFQAMRSRNAAELNTDVETGVLAANLAHMANISYRTGRKLQFDPGTMTFPGEKEANRLLTRPHRAPYIVPEKV